MEHLKNISYFQFHKELDYPIFIKFEEPKVEKMLVPIIEALGFNKVENEVLGKIKIDKNSTRVLVIKEATARVARQVVRPYSGLESLGAEDITPYGGHDVYRYMNAAIMMMGHHEYYWEMAVCNFEEKNNEIKVALTRYLAIALANLEIVGFWGKDFGDEFLVTKAKNSNFESFFVDMRKGIFISKSGIKPINQQVGIMRIDETYKGAPRKMSKEQLLSFLCHNTTYLSYMGLDFKLKKAIFDLVDHVHGHVVATEYFQKNSSLQLA